MPDKQSPEPQAGPAADKPKLIITPEERAVKRAAMSKEERREIDEALFWEVREGGLAKIRDLVASGADVDQIHNLLAKTPLTEAIGRGDIDVVRCLVKEGGADVEKADFGFGKHPLSLAAFRGHADIVRFLVKEGGADVEKADKIFGTPPLLEAAFQGDIDVVRCLVNECGADVNYIHKERKTALHLAMSSYKPNTEVISFLIDKQEFDLKSEKGSKLLAYAANRGPKENVQWLHENGAKITFNVLQAAAGNRRDYSQVLTYLVENSETRLTLDQGDELIAIATEARNPKIRDYINQTIDALGPSTGTGAMNAQEQELVRRLADAESEEGTVEDKLKVRIDFTSYRVSEGSYAGADIHYREARKIIRHNQELRDHLPKLKLLWGFINNIKGRKNVHGEKEKYYQDALYQFEELLEDYPLAKIGSAEALAGTGEVDEAIVLQQDAYGYYRGLPEEAQKIYDESSLYIDGYKKQKDLEERESIDERMDRGFRNTNVHIDEIDKNRADADAEQSRVLNEMKETIAEQSKSINKMNNTIVEKNKSIDEMKNNITHLRKESDKKEEFEAGAFIVALLGVVVGGLQVGLASQQEDITSTCQVVNDTVKSQEEDNTLMNQLDMAVGVFVLLAAVVTVGTGAYNGWQKKIPDSLSRWGNRCKSSLSSCKSNWRNRFRPAQPIVRPNPEDDANLEAGRNHQDDEGVTAMRDVTPGEGGRPAFASRARTRGDMVGGTGRVRGSETLI